VKFGIVADDNTGAADAAGMLTARGVRTILILDWSSKAEAVEATAPFDAVVLGTEARSVAPDVAFQRTAEAVDLLKTIGVDTVQVKYCSTFDSTPEGTIGPSLDAAADRLGAPGTIVCPALPVNGRVTFLGYHFVNGLLLSESPMRDHPLNPMTDSNLVRWLQQQTDRRVGLADLYAVRRGPRALRRFLDSRVADGCCYLVTDAIEQHDLAVIAEATSDWPLLSGGSGITAAIPAVHFPGRDPLSFAHRLSDRKEGAIVLAGSCSPATRSQNAFAARNGFRSFRLSGLEVLDGAVDLGGIAEQAVAALADGDNIILSASAGPEEVARVQEHGRRAGLSVPEVGRRIAAALADVTALTVTRAGVGTLIVSGGGTAGAVCRRLGIRSLEVGLPIEPGVPYCFPLDGPQTITVLKSGNFGSEDFYLRALACLGRGGGPV